MQGLVLFLSQFLLGWLVIQVFCVTIFLYNLRIPGNKLLPDHKLPKTAVILCLRGADPFLPDCLRSLLTQNYPNYGLELVIDSPQDPAWKIATDIIAEVGATNVQISNLTMRRDSCTLKCSSLVQAVSQLDDSYEVVALVDADAVVHPNWLRELVTPLNDPQVGATTGNRWYTPAGKYWGTRVRYLWNVSAVVQMYLYRIPWGGTLAVKTEVIRQTKLLDKWGKAYCEDTMIRGVLAKFGLQVKFVPSLLILNQEECNLPSLLNWMKRQLLASRLYHPLWYLVTGDAFLTVLLPNLLLLLAIVAVSHQQWYLVWISLASFGSYIIALLLLAIALDIGVRKVIPNQSQKTSKLSLAVVAKMLMGIPLTNWVYSFVLVSSLWMPKLNWRGIFYQIKGPWNIQLLQYSPYQSLDQPTDHQVSL